MARHQPGLVDHDFPLRPDLMITIRLPVDLTSDDAERLCGFVRSLVFQEGEGDG